MTHHTANDGTQAIPHIYNSGGGDQGSAPINPVRVTSNTGRADQLAIANIVTDSDPSPTTRLPSSSKNKVTRGNKTSTKHVPATDTAGFEIECKKKQLATAQAKIQELEAEKTKLSKTNHILSARIKLFENMQENEIYETYYPSRSAPDNVSQPVSTKTCCKHHCCPVPPCHTHHQCSGSSQDTRGIKDIIEKVDRVLDAINNLKSDLTVSPSSLPTQTQQPLTLSPLISVVQMSENQHTPERPSSNCPMPHNISTSSSNTIDDQVDTIEVIDLNSFALTNQFPQLMQ